MSLRNPMLSTAALPVLSEPSCHGVILPLVAAGDFMELALNLAWVIIAAASYALLFRHLATSRSRRADGRVRCQCVVALRCALTILFPVISLTDDLHETQAVVEEPSSSRVVLKKFGANRPPAPTRNSHRPLFIASSFNADVGWSVIGNIARQPKAHASPGLLLTPVGRAPPFSSPSNRPSN